MRHRRGTVAAPCTKNRCQAVVIAAVGAALQRVEHFLDQIVNVQKLQLGGAVVYRDGQVVRHVIAERRHGAVVIGAAPFAEQIREAVDIHRRAGLLGIIEEQFLARQLAFAVIAARIAAKQSCLYRTRKHDRAGVAVRFERVQQGGSKAKVALHELVVVLRAVDARQVEHKVGFCTKTVQLCGRRVKVVRKHFLNRQRREGAIFAVADVLQIFAEVAAHKAFCPCYKDFHAFFSASISFRAFCTYSVVKIFFTVPSTSRRFVLWLV